MASNATARRRGKDWERQIRDYSREVGFDYEPLRQTGQNDEGDGVYRLGDGIYVVVEAKNTQKIELAGHIAEAEAEATNFAVHRNRGKDRVYPVVFQKRRGKGTGQAYAVMTVEAFLRLLKEVEQ